MIKGFTTGVYDMFHVGHLRLLKNAKDHCDFLTVGVSSDELVLSYKNKSPIISLNDRMEIVRAISYVDDVVPIETRDKKEQFFAHKYNRLFVGDDWKGSEIFFDLERFLKLHGAEIKYFSYTKDVSSTSLKDVLKEIYNREFS